MKGCTCPLIPLHHTADLPKKWIREILNYDNEVKSAGDKCPVFSPLQITCLYQVINKGGNCFIIS